MLMADWKSRGKEDVLFADLVDTKNPRNALQEVESVLAKLHLDIDYDKIRKVHSDVVALYSGKYPGYRECDTGYHDLHHTMDVFLAMARIIHGAYIEGLDFGKRNVTLGVISALLHDTGYIQSEDDNNGTGAKYTTVHVKRSMAFMETYLSENGYTEEDRKKCRGFIECTDLGMKIQDVSFDTEQLRTMGRMHFAADLMGQMADRVYLEKLHILYDEFVEGGITAYSDEKDLLEKTIAFYEIIDDRIKGELGDMDKYMRNHFRERWDIDKDLYHEAIEKNITYLKYILSHYGDDYYTKLKRMGEFKKVGGLE
jgi:hypothetical protein